MKILQVITSLQTGGAETLLVNMVARLRAMGHTVDVCVFNGKATPLMQRLASENPGIRIYRLGRGYYNPLYIPKLARIMRHYDIVHSHNSSPQLFVAIAGLASHATLCTTEHTTSNRKRHWKWYAPIERFTYSRYSHIVCISEIAEQKLREYLGGKWADPQSPKYARISTINNGIDIAAITAATPLPGARSEGEFVATMVAGFRESKDQDTAIKAMAFLPQNYTLWLVGDGRRRNTLMKLAHDIGVGNRVKFWGERSDVARILKSSDVILMSSHWEGLSLSSIEGMSANKPFVASCVNGLKQIVENYGLLFREGDAQQLANTIRRLHNNPALYRATAERCLHQAHNFSISTTVAEYSQLYEDLLANRQDKHKPSKN